MKFIITPEIYEKCQQFAENSVSTSIDKYAKRNQFNVEKIKKDIFYGKIGEEGVHSLMKNKFPNLSQPDHNIYDKKNKGWDADLKEMQSNISIAVKSQNINSALEFSDSWIFQGGINKITDCDAGVFKIKDDKHYAVFVSLNVPKRFGEIRAIVKISWLHEKNLFKETQKENLKNNKSAVYFSDLELYPNELWQI